MKICQLCNVISPTGEICNRLNCPYKNVIQINNSQDLKIHNLYEKENDDKFKRGIFIKDKLINYKFFIASIIFVTFMYFAAMQVAIYSFYKNEYYISRNIYENIPFIYNKEAEYQLGIIYRMGLGGGVNYSKSIKFLKSASEDGHRPAQSILGMSYVWGSDGLGGKYPEEGRRLIQNALQEGDVSAEYASALLYVDGRLAIKDTNLANKYGKRAAIKMMPLANSGDPIAQYRICALYSVGAGLPKSGIEALKWCRLAADRGLGAAQAHLALSYLKGDGVKKNYKEGAHWARMSAESGFAFGEALVGVMFLDGIGYDKNYAEALRWLRRAASKESGWALNRIGGMYARGDGVPENDKEAVRLLRLARDTGYAGP